MNCPKCDSEMEKVVHSGIEVDRCTDCGGIWFDMLEHKALKIVPGSEAIDTGDPAVGREMSKIEHINCPVCKTPMARMVDKEQPDLWCEGCAACNGIFFDAGEFTDFKQETTRSLFGNPRAREQT